MSTPSTAIPETPAESPTPADPAAPPRRPMAPGRLWACAMIAALVAGGMTTAFHEATPTAFSPPPHMVRFMGRMVDQPRPQDIAAADRKNAILLFGVGGGLLAACLGLAGGVARRSAGWAIAADLVGLVLGVAAGAGSAAVAATEYHRQLLADMTRITQQMAVPLLLHAGIWSAIGLAAGLALGIGAGARRQIGSAILGGILGGAIGSGLYDVVASLAWPGGRTYQVIAGAWPPRVLAVMLPALVTALVATVGLTSEHRRPARTPAINPEP